MGEQGGVLYMLDGCERQTPGQSTVCSTSLGGCFHNNNTTKDAHEFSQHNSQSVKPVMLLPRFKSACRMIAVQYSSGNTTFLSRRSPVVQPPEKRRRRRNHSLFVPTENLFEAQRLDLFHVVGTQKKTGGSHVDSRKFDSFSIADDCGRVNDAWLTAPTPRCFDFSQLENAIR